MSEVIRRGFVPTDIIEFNEESISLLHQAQKDISYLIDHGYELERSVTFVCNRFGLSKRQRMALTRSTSKECDIRQRLACEITDDLEGKTIYIDGFNLIIPLEIALSGSTLLLCMDGTIRDLAGLHGTYRLIDKTSSAISLINKQLSLMKIAKAVFYFDAPVSNSGKIKSYILDQAQYFPFTTEVHVIHNVDQTLYDKEIVASSDAIILNNCKSWVNLSRLIIRSSFPDYPFVDLRGYKI